VLALVEALLADETLALDPRQVYVAGLSSGGSEAVVLGCLAPEVFAGVGVAAGPALGTTREEIGAVATTADRAQGLCRRLAGPRARWLESQSASVVAGRADFLVAPGYADVNAEMYAALAAGDGPPLETTPFDVSALAGHAAAGEGRLWSTAARPRVSRMLVEGLGHAFPAGSGADAADPFVASTGPSWPLYLARFFSSANPRLGGDPPAGSGCRCARPPGPGGGRGAGLLAGGGGFGLLALRGERRRRRAARRRRDGRGLEPSA
jgi:poly(3-hydroxybutyrate) depolymerase